MTDRIGLDLGDLGHQPEMGRRHEEDGEIGGLAHLLEHLAHHLTRRLRGQRVFGDGGAEGHDEGGASMV